MTDGAAAVMLMTRQEAAKRGLPILGIFRRWGWFWLGRAALFCNCVDWGGLQDSRSGHPGHLPQVGLVLVGKGCAFL